MPPTRIPGITYASPPTAEAYASTLAWPPRLVVIHDTGNPTSTKEGEASYAASRPKEGATSAHAYIDNGGALGSLRLDRQAWAAYSYANAHGIHLEMCLTGDRNLTRQLTALLTRQLCDMAGIPAVKLSPSQVAAGQRGVCGHRDITIGLGVGDHTDPGADFPWPQFMAWVNEGTPDVGTLEGDQARRLLAVDETAYAALLMGNDTANIPPPATGGTWTARPVWLVGQVKELVATSRAARTAVEALTAALNTVLSGGGSVDSAAVVAHMDQLAADEIARDTELRQQLATVQARNVRLAAALAAAGVALDEADDDLPAG